MSGGPLSDKETRKLIITTDSELGLVFPMATILLQNPKSLE